MAEVSPEPFGKLLVEARASRGMTLQEISASTKIPVSKLQAIERDDIENLPGGIFTRGFVRSYAEAVGLDPQETLAQFEERFPNESSVATLHATIEGRANEEFVRRQRVAKGMIWFGLLAAVLVVWLLAVVVREDRPAPAATDEAVAGEVELSEVARQEPPPAAPAASRPAEAEADPEPPPAAPAAAGRLTMEISPTADCWVLASADGDTVISRVLAAGEREVVVAEGTIEMRIGDAGAFTFTINRRPGRSLGGAGEVVDVRVTQANYLSFVAE